MTLAQGSRFSPYGIAARSAGGARRPRVFIALEAVSLCTFALLMIALVGRVMSRATNAREVAACALAAGAGWLAADCASGLVHWFADTFFEEDTPWIGPLLIQPFREHHRDPQAMTRHGFLELFGNSALALIPLLGAAFVAPLAPPLQAAAAVFALGLFATNLFHKWAHDSAPPALVRWLQSRWLILPPAHHFRHHTPGYDAAYCVTTGWTNAIADASGVFTVLRRVLVGLRVPAVRGMAGTGSPAFSGDGRREG